MASKSMTMMLFVEEMSAVMKDIRQVTDRLEEAVLLGYAASLTNQDAAALHPELTAAHLTAAKNALDAINATLDANSNLHRIAMLRLLDLDVTRTV